MEVLIRRLYLLDMRDLIMIIVIIFPVEETSEYFGGC